MSGKRVSSSADAPHATWKRLRQPRLLERQFQALEGLAQYAEDMADDADVDDDDDALIDPRLEGLLVLLARPEHADAAAAYARRTPSTFLALVSTRVFVPRALELFTFTAITSAANSLRGEARGYAYLYWLLDTAQYRTAWAWSLLYFSDTSKLLDGYLFTETRPVPTRLGFFEFMSKHPIDCLYLVRVRPYYGTNCVSICTLMAAIHAGAPVALEWARRIRALNVCLGNADFHHNDSLNIDTLSRRSVTMIYVSAVLLRATAFLDVFCANPSIAEVLARTLECWPSFFVHAEHACAFRQPHACVLHALDVAEQLAAAASLPLKWQLPVIGDLCARSTSPTLVPAVLAMPNDAVGYTIACHYTYENPTAHADERLGDVALAYLRDVDEYLDEPRTALWTCVIEALPATAVPHTEFVRRALAFAPGRALLAARPTFMLSAETLALRLEHDRDSDGTRAALEAALARDDLCGAAEALAAEHGCAVN